MNFADAGAFDDSGGIPLANTSTCHDDDAAAGGLGETGDGLGALQAFWFTTGGQKAVGAGSANVLESAEKVGRHVECAMEGNIERARQLDQLARAADIDVAFGIEQA